MAIRCGPTKAQAEKRDRMVNLCRRIQDTHYKVLRAVQNKAKEQGEDARQQRHRELGGGGAQNPARRVSPPHHMQPGELRTWGPHLVTGNANGGYQCTTCGRTAKCVRARRAMRGLTCVDGRGPRPGCLCQEARENWRAGWGRHWGDLGPIPEGEPLQIAPGQHDLVRYYHNKKDGRWLCMICGLNYVRRTCINRQACAGEPVKPRAIKALQDAAMGLPLDRRAVFRNAATKAGASIDGAGRLYPGLNREELRLRDDPLEDEGGSHGSR